VITVGAVRDAALERFSVERRRIGGQRKNTKRAELYEKPKFIFIADCLRQLSRE